MKTVFHPEASRGAANHGWLNAKHSFSFASWYNPERLQFGVLRVLNDDRIQGGAGFGRHPHDNMEIITIVTEGKLEHKDSLGTTGEIKPGEVQVMSAGKGIFHSEYNGLAHEETALFQLWVIPASQNVTPRYDQKAFEWRNEPGKLHLVVSNDGRDNSLMIHQNAFISIGRFDENELFTYVPHSSGNGVYFMQVEGESIIAGQALSRRDAVGVSEASEISIQPKPGATIMAIEVPLG